MKIKIEASKRLIESTTEENAGWWESLSDVAKKAYQRLHPNSRAGKGGQPSKPSTPAIPSNKSSSPAAKKPAGNQAAIDNAKQEHEKAKENYNRIRDSKGDTRTDSEWDEHDKALDHLYKTGEKHRKLSGIKPGKKG